MFLVLDSIIINNIDCQLIAINLKKMKIRFEMFFPFTDPKYWGIELSPRVTAPLTESILNEASEYNEDTTKLHVE